MNRLSLLFIALALCCLALPAHSQVGGREVPIIPAPNSVTRTAGTFLLDTGSAILFETEEDYKIAKLFQEFLKGTFQLDLPVAKNFIRAPKSTIRFSSAGFTGLNPEAYTLGVAPGQVAVSGKGAGLFYGLQSLLQLFPADGTNGLRLPCVDISDEPRYRYRGMHLDVGRHFFSIAFVKKYIDVLAAYKLNTFHWHLTDDQGWRIEIKKYPLLTTVGGYRAQTVIGNYHDRMPQWFDGTRYGGSYTQEEIKEVVAYAADRFISVIPEIDMPGHSMSALAAYPDLACGERPGPFLTAEKWGVFPDVYCPGKEATFTFLEDVLTEVMALFPSSYIHIGGDECPKTRWKTCAYCQRRMRSNGLKTEEQLQSYFIQRIERFVNSRGRKVIGWDEILQGGLAPNATVMAWQTVNAGIAAAKQDHDVIMTPQAFVYLDHLQGRADQEPLTIGGATPLEEVYSFDPTPTSLSLKQQQRIIGVQANVWTEYMTTEKKVEYMLFPRVYALAEIAWTWPGRKNYTDFSAVRVPKHLAALDHTATNYRVPVAIGAKDTTMFGPRFRFSFPPSVVGARVFYTINGYPPGETDRELPDTLDITVPAGERRMLQTVVITPSGKRSAITKTRLLNEAPQPALDSVMAKPGLNYYYVPGDVESTADIDTGRAEEKGVTTDLSNSRFRAKARTYGLIFSGFINIPQDGLYVFSTYSDDGSQIWIDDKLIVDNDQKHALFELTGIANVLKGVHKIKIRYFQAGGSSGLTVYQAAAGRTKSEIPAAWLSH